MTGQMMGSDVNWDANKEVLIIGTAQEVMTHQLLLACRYVETGFK